KGTFYRTWSSPAPTVSVPIRLKARYQNFDQVQIRDRQNGTNLSPCRISAGADLVATRYQKVASHNGDYV
ncbi:hypothetical protein, partial [Pseudomonas aeruginosa]|uniref:hypothetical protein n=1 Tax=Pseudomonas aeruginosa TaxID=287 RepID=UPI000FEFDD7E